MGVRSGTIEMYNQKLLQFLIIVSCEQDNVVVSKKIVTLTGCTIVAEDEVASGLQYVVRSKLSPAEFWEKIYELKDEVEVYELMGHTDKFMLGGKS